MWNGEKNVYQGTYKKDLTEIRNGNRHVRITPYLRSKKDLPHETQFQGSPKVYNVMWAGKENYCKKCYSTHMLMEDCSPPPNRRFDSTAKKNGNKHVENRAVRPNTPSHPPIPPP